MYAPFFGLTQAPFSIAPDPRLLFMSERHREALAHLLYGVAGGGGFVLLTGEIGTGKTTVCRSFLEQIPANCNVAYIFNPKLTAIELLQSICDEFHIVGLQQGLLHPTIKSYLDPLNAFLLAQHAQGRNNVLIIDEAQNLAPEVLEQLRLLTNLETSERKLLQVILIGQPELRTMLQRPELEQLAQRVIARYHLDALSEAETAQYIQHRLEVSGLNRALPFDRKALRRIHTLTRGVPRRINLLCDRALLGAFAGSHAMVTPAMVDQAAGEVFDRRPAHASSLWRRSAALLGLSVLAGAVLVGVTRLLVPAAVTPVARSAPASGPVAQAAAPVPPAATGASSAPLSDTVAQAALPSASAPLSAASASAPASAAVTATTSIPAAGTGAAVVQAAAPPTLLRDADQAWRELAQAWNLEPGGGAACPAFARGGVQCFSGTTSLALIRQLGRPGIVTLDRQSRSPSYALLVALHANSATLRAGASEQTVTLAALAERWQGDFATLWRAPAGYDGARIPDGGGGPGVAWVVARLAAVNGQPLPAGRPLLDAALRARVRSFQIAQGLPADGKLGPMTFMQLNRVSGVDEPRLRTGP